MRDSYYKLKILSLLFILNGLSLGFIKYPKLGYAQETFLDSNNSYHWILCIDSSQRMGTPLFYNIDRMDLVEIAASLFTKLIVPNDKFSLVSYAEESTLEFSIPESSSEGSDTKEFEIQSIIDSIIPEGLPFLGEGLNESLRVLEKEEIKYNDCIILLSNQWSRDAITAEGTLPGLIARGARLYTIGIGSIVDHSLLMELSTQTGGRYQYVPDEIYLPASFASLWSEIIGGAELARQFNVILSGENLFEPVPVDPYCQQVIFILYWMNKDSDLECLLIDPDGTRITALSGIVPSAIYPYSEISYISRNLYSIYKINDPIPGIWQMKIISPSGSDENPYVLEVIAKNKEEYLDVFSINSDKRIYGPSDLIQLQAFLDVEELIGEISIKGKISGPQRFLPEIILYDDGLPEHNDQITLDGIFSNFYTPCPLFSEEGSSCQISLGPYVFNLTAFNDIAVASEGQNPSNYIYGYPFQRRASLTVLVDDGELNLSPVADAGPDKVVVLGEDDKEAIIQLDGSNSYDPEGGTLDFAWFAPGIIFDDPTNPTPTGTFPIGSTIVTLMVSDGKNISEPDEIKITAKNKEERQYYNSIFQYSPYNALLPQYLSIYNKNDNLSLFSMYLLASSFLPYNPLSYSNFSWNLRNSLNSSNTLSMIIDSPYTTNFVFGSGYLNSAINIIINNYYTYNYYYY
ncbi:MAG: VWA domain-containing protein [bacterium]